MAGRSITRIVLLFCCAAVQPASAQYTFDPNNADEQLAGVKYFGSVKDERGALLTGASILIAQRMAVVTDEQGRYRVNVDVQGADKASVACSKPGYSLLRVTRRPGPSGGVKKTVQADCVLRQNHK